MTSSLSGCALFDDGGEDDGTVVDTGDPGEIPEGPITIAHSRHTGVLPTIGDGSRDAIELLVEDVNENGGVLGEREIELHLVDEAAGADEYTSELRRLDSQEGVDIHIGMHASSTALAAAPVADELGIPFMSWGAGTPELWEHLNESDWVFRSVSNGIAYVSAGVHHAINELEGIESVGAVVQDYAWGHAAEEMIETLFEQLAPDVDLEVRFHPLFEQDLTSVITALDQEDHDLIFNATWGGDHMNFVRQADAAGMWDDTEGLFILGQSVAQDLGTDTPEGLHFGVNGMELFDRNMTPEKAAFVDAYHDRYDRYPTYPEFSTRVALQWYISAIETGYQVLGGYPSDEQIARLMEGYAPDMTNSTVALSVPHHEAKHGSAYGRTTYEDEHDFAVLEDVTYYPAHRVNNPDQIEPFDWLNQYNDLNP